MEPTRVRLGVLGLITFATLLNPAPSFGACCNWVAVAAFEIFAVHRADADRVRRSLLNFPQLPDPAARL